MSPKFAGLISVPKPAKDSKREQARFTFVTNSSINHALQLATTATGFSLWLGQTKAFKLHAGAKFVTNPAEVAEEGIFTAVDIPKKIVFMIESLGEFDFKFIQRGAEVQIEVAVSRSVIESDRSAWISSVAKVIESFEMALQNG